MTTATEFLVLGTETKSEILKLVIQYLDALGLAVSSVDSERPWGGFFVIDEAHTGNFISAHFPDLELGDIEKGGRLSPKILIVEPGKRLSWQYHNRREELWMVISGPVGVITSETDTHNPVEHTHAGATVQFGTKIRHRLVGLKTWGVIAEIWQHTDPTNPSNEDDIIRVADDFGR